MPEIGLSGSMSGEWKRDLRAPAPFLDSTDVRTRCTSMARIEKPSARRRLQALTPCTQPNGGDMLTATGHRRDTTYKEILVPSDPKQELKKVAEKLKAAAAKAKQLKDTTNAADVSMDKVEKENK